MSAATLDFDARYAVDGYAGIAFWLKGWHVEQVAGEYWDDEIGEECWLDEPIYSDTFVVAVMVGDDYEHVIDVADLVPLGDLDYCAQCGQIGCGHDGRDRS